MAIALHHVNISTPDMDRLSAFYEKAFGFVAVFEHNLEDYAITEMITGVKGAVARTVTLKGANCFMELFEWSAPKGRPLEPLRPYDYGYTHICWAVDDIDAEYKRLSELGVPFVYSAPVPSEFELLQAPRGASISLDMCSLITMADLPLP